MLSASDESQLLLAIQAVKANPNLSRQRAAAIYNVPINTLCQRLKGRQSRRDIVPNSRKMADLEESTIVRYVLELDSQGFPPRLSHVEDMANRLLDQRGVSRLGRNFIRRHPELKTRFTRRYDFQRALCEDPIQGDMAALWRRAGQRPDASIFCLVMRARDDCLVKPYKVCPANAGLIYEVHHQIEWWRNAAIARSVRESFWALWGNLRVCTHCVSYGVIG